LVFRKTAVSTRVFFRTCGSHKCLCFSALFPLTTGNDVWTVEQGIIIYLISILRRRCFICPAQSKFLISMCLEARRHGRIYVARRALPFNDNVSARVSVLCFVRKTPFRYGIHFSHDVFTLFSS
jgi:hypothetical protein